MRQLYSVKNDRFGTTFNPANRASPSSSTELMTWLWRALPKSFSASSERNAHAAGTIFEPGKTAPREERVQIGRDQPWQEQVQAAELGAEVARCQVELADVGPLRPQRERGWSGRSSSPRRGSLANPSSSRIAATAAGLSDSSSRRGARLMSWTERFCFRSATTCFPQSFLRFPGGRTLPRGGDEEVAAGLVAELMDEDPKTSRCVPEPSGRFGGRGHGRRRRPAGLRIADGWSWRAPRSGRASVGDLWNYRPCATVLSRLNIAC